MAADGLRIAQQVVAMNEEYEDFSTAVAATLFLLTVIVTISVATFFVMVAL